MGQLYTTFLVELTLVMCEST